MPEQGRETFARYKKPINWIVKVVSVFSLKRRLSLFERFRNTKGKKGIAIRYILLKSIAKYCGDNVAIFSNVFLLNPQHLSIGTNVSIHPLSYVECGNSMGITIGNDVSIAHGVSILATSHNFLDITKNIKDQGVTEKGVEIEDNVWIGAKATIVAGITVAEGCVIGANSVVTRSTDKFGVYVGAPAKKIKNRLETRE